ncbi:MAG: MFS transporter [Verrucomicrobia bacterium]|nr:MFS transporter [Verrucomicrobiota bacterium]
MTRKPISLKFILTATLLGNTLEWYEWATYAFMVPLFSQIFFPSADHLLSLIYTMVGFACGSVFRPIGGLIFGYIGDTYGRKVALIFSVLFMTIPTFAIGILPTYWQIGAVSTVLLIFFRLLQGIASGGELPGVMVFLGESSPHEKRPFFISFTFWGIALGIFIGGLDFFILTDSLSSETISESGWRAVFILGAILGCVAFFMRRMICETAPFQKLRESHEILKDPIVDLFKDYKSPLMKVIGYSLLETLAFNSIIAFSITNLTEYFDISFKEAVVLNLAKLGCLVCLIPVGGVIAQRIGAKRFAFWLSLSFLFFSYPFHLLVLHPGYRLWGALGFSFMMAFYMACLPTLVYDLFPAKVRYSGIALGYNLSVGIFGAFSPLVILYLVHVTGFTIYPVLFLMVGAISTLITLRSDRKTHL